MNLYQSLLVVHVLSVVIWLGGSLSMLILWRRALGSGDEAVIATQAETARWFDLRVSLPAAVVVLAVGGWLMTEGNWGMDQGWLHIGMTAVFAGAGIALIWTNRLQRRASLSLGSSVQARITLGMAGTSIILLVALWAMIAKPLS